jgi:hypothetical protein
LGVVYSSKSAQNAYFFTFENFRAFTKTDHLVHLRIGGGMGQKSQPRVQLDRLPVGNLLQSLAELAEATLQLRKFRISRADPAHFIQILMK